jgi:hypothetical protein
MTAIVRVTHCGSLTPVPASCRSRIAFSAFSVRPISCVPNAGVADMVVEFLSLGCGSGGNGHGDLAGCNEVAFADEDE